jgi:nucleotide-binding universal stress UspA family protein
MTEAAVQLADVEQQGQSLAGATVGRVIVGVDDSEPGLAALAVAARLAREHGAQLIAVRAWALGLPRHGGRRMRHLAHPHVVLSFSGAEQRVAAKVLVRRAFRSVIGGMPAAIPVQIKTPGCDPAVALVGLATRPGDVIVLGRDSGHPFRRLVHGSVSQYCVRHARCPVLLVPKSGRVTETGRAAGRRHFSSP